MDIKAYAKVNLTLDVKGKRSDGYHELETVMLSVGLYDEVHMEFGGSDITLESYPPLPVNSAAFRAAVRYSESAGTDGCRITVLRHIPEAAGLGGSSADAAGVLAGMQAAFGALDGDALARLALEIGSDVPFMMKGGCALCRGRGELMTPLPVPELNLLIAKPVGSISTGELFGSLALGDMPSKSGAMAEAIRAGDYGGICAAVSNALTDRGIELCPETGKYIEILLNSGADAASMTGSGSAVFGLFSDADAAHIAVKRLKDVAFVGLYCPVKL